jgi:hypothetical protein
MRGFRKTAGKSTRNSQKIQHETADAENLRSPCENLRILGAAGILFSRLGAADALFRAVFSFSTSAEIS